MAGDRIANFRRELFNKLLLLFVLTLIVGVPLYAGMIGTYALYYGQQYLLDLNPLEPVTHEYLAAVAIQLWTYWWENRALLDQETTLKIAGPPAAGLFTTLVLLYAARAPLLDFRPFRRKESIHGDAHWATEGEVRRAKLRAKRGLLLGRTGKSDYLIADDFQHVLLFAPTGSGKGVGFVIPNLLFWEQSCICHDIKLENYELTSGWRQKVLKQECFVWNPADPDGVSHCYNPLDWVSTKPGQMVDDVQKICNLILPEQEFWQNEARSLMLGVILYLIAVPEKVKSFGEVVRTMRSDDVVYNLAVVLDTIGKRIHPVAYMNIAAFLQKADKERSGVISTLNSGLELWANPLIDATTARSDFDLQQMKKKKITVYCGVTPDNLKRLEPLLKVFYQQAADFMTRKMPGKDEPIGVLLMMDEFPSLGEMPMFQTGIAYFRGYRVKLFLIVQDTQQLKGIYEEAGMNSFLSNSYYRVTFAANNIETANMISQLVGNKTAVQYSKNQPKYLDMNPASRTVNTSEVQRALLLPQEVVTLPRDEQIIIIESHAPIRTKKIFYYKDKFFMKRVLPKIDVPVQEPYDPRKKKAAPPPADQPPQQATPAAETPPPPPPDDGNGARQEAPPPPEPDTLDADGENEDTGLDLDNEEDGEDRPANPAV